MLKLQKISFSYGKKPVLRDFSMELQNGEILAVMGPSGCGKSTLLSLIAGLKKPSAGVLLSDFARPAFVFQEPRLFPWLTVRENLAAVADKALECDKEIPAALDAVALADAIDLYPRELSGGMKSRVSLARALVFKGDLYLLDEPFAALDEALKKTVSERLRAWLKAHGASAILVTHDSADAERMADRILTLPPHPPTDS